MLPKEIIQLVEEIFELSGKQEFSGGKREREWAQKDPEAALHALLTQIKKDLPDVSSNLRFTVEFGTFHTEKSRKLLDQSKTEVLAISQ